MVGKRRTGVKGTVYHGGMRNCSSCASANPPEAQRCATCGTLLDAPISDPLEGELLKLVKEGNPIEAIRLLRERRGLGLKEAKEVVDALAAGRRGVAPAPAAKADLGIEPDLIALLKRGRTIEAIKLRRGLTGE